MPTKKSLPFTIQLPSSLHDSLVRLQQKRKLGSKTLTVLYAIGSFDMTKLKPDEDVPVQISFRLPAALTPKLEKHAKRVGISTGEIVRRALEAAR